MMTTDDNANDRIEQFVTAYLLYLDGVADRPELRDLPEADRAEASARLDILDGLRTAGARAPAGAADRIARLFGFDRAGSRIHVSGARFKRARNAKGMTLKDIASAATSAGIPVRTADLLKVETSPTTPLDQELVTVLAAILATSVDLLESDVVDEMTEMRAFLDGPEFEELVRDWALTKGRDLDETLLAVRDHALAVQYRAKGTTVEQLADMVRAILRSLE